MPRWRLRAVLVQWGLSLTSVPDPSQSLGLPSGSWEKAHIKYKLKKWFYLKSVYDIALCLPKRKHQAKKGVIFLWVHPLRWEQVRLWDREKVVGAWVGPAQGLAVHRGSWLGPEGQWGLVGVVLCVTSDSSAWGLSRSIWPDLLVSSYEPPWIISEIFKRIFMEN